MTFVQLSDSKVQPLVDYNQVQRRPHEIAQASAGTFTYIVIAKNAKTQQLAFHAKNDQYPHRYSVHSKQEKPFQ